MIRSICMNPAIDRMYYIDNFTPGVQYRGNLPSVMAGGKGINVARICAALGEQTSVYGYVGGANGKLVRAEMARLGVKDHFILLQEETRTTINIIDPLVRQETEVIEQGPTVAPHHIEGLLKKLRRDIQRGDVVICSGLTVPGAPEDIYPQISVLCQVAQAHCFLDTNGENLKASLAGQYTFLKPNRQELLALYDQADQGSLEQLYALARRAHSRVENILVSLGIDGALYYGADSCYKITVPDVPVVNTIGCGDSSVAGFAVGLARGLPLEDTIRLSMGCAVLNSMQDLMQDIDLEQLNTLTQQIQLMPFTPTERKEHP